MRALPGWIYIYKGVPQENYMLHGGMILTHHKIRYFSTGHQVNVSYGESLKSKLKCERYATNCAILVQAYHTENGVLTSRKFMEVIIGEGQNIRFVGVGDAQQNGVSVHSIKTITSRDHTMMINAYTRSP